MTICYHILSILLGTYLQIESLSHMAVLTCNFLKNTKIFSKAGRHHFTFSPAMYQDSNLFLFLPTLVLLCHCSFNLTSFCIHLGMLISSAVIVEVPLFKYVFSSHILASVIILKNDLFSYHSSKMAISFCFYFCLFNDLLRLILDFFFSKTLWGTRNIKFTKSVLL